MAKQSFRAGKAVSFNPQVNHIPADKTPPHAHVIKKPLNNSPKDQAVVTKQQIHHSGPTPQKVTHVFKPSTPLKNPVTTNQPVAAVRQVHHSGHMPNPIRPMPNPIRPMPNPIRPMPNPIRPMPNPRGPVPVPRSKKVIHTVKPSTPLQNPVITNQPVLHAQPVAAVRQVHHTPVCHAVVTNKPKTDTHTVIVHTSKKDTETISPTTRVVICSISLIIFIGGESLLCVKMLAGPRMYSPFVTFFPCVMMAAIIVINVFALIYNVYGLFSSQNNNKEVSNDTSTVASDQKNTQENTITNSEDNQYKSTETTTDEVPSKILTDGIQSSTHQSMTRS